MASQGGEEAVKGESRPAEGAGEGVHADEQKKEKKLSLKEMYQKKNKKIEVAEFVPDKKEKADPPPPPPEKNTRAWFIEESNRTRWEEQAVENERLTREAMQERQEYYEELQPEKWPMMNEEKYKSYWAMLQQYIALNNGMTLDELENLKDTLQREDFNMVYKNYLKFQKLLLFSKNKNTDDFERMKGEVDARLFPKTTDKEKKKPMKATTVTPPIAPPKMVIAPPKKTISFRQEEKLDKARWIELAKEKSLNIPDQKREPLVMIFIGHVDSGKSTIAGSMLILSGKVDQLEVSKLKEEAKKYNRESWYVAYLNDCLDEEKERGKTVEMSRVDIDLERKHFTIFDCPGHRTYTQNMMTGAAQADVACLMISAKQGEFEAGFEREGQTREHAMLARAVGVTRLVVVVNKMDAVDWDKKRFDYIKEKLEAFLINNCGFEKSEIFWVIVCGMNGAFVKERPSPNPAPWYTGRTFFETLDNLPPIIRSKENYLRIPVLDKLKDDGELSIYGKIESGLVHNDMTCVLMPAMKTFTVGTVEVGEGHKLAFAEPGESLRLIVKGLEDYEIKRGQVICGTQFWTPVCRQFEAEIRIFHLTSNMTITSGFDFMMHLHTLMEEATIHKVLSKVVFEDHKPITSSAHLLKSGETGIVRIHLKQPICVEKFTHVPQMGRFVMRKESTTIAAGIITRIKVLNEETLKNNNFFLSQLGLDASENVPASKDIKPVELFPVQEKAEDGDDLM